MGQETCGHTPPCPVSGFRSLSLPRLVAFHLTHLFPGGPGARGSSEGIECLSVPPELMFDGSCLSSEPRQILNVPVVFAVKLSFRGNPCGGSFTRRRSSSGLSPSNLLVPVEFHKKARFSPTFRNRTVLVNLSCRNKRSVVAVSHSDYEAGRPYRLIYRRPPHFCDYCAFESW